MSGINFTRRAFELAAEDKIQKAAEQGEFDNLPGKGKPIPGLNPHHVDAPDWWVKQWVERESLNNAMKPTPQTHTPGATRSV